MEFLARTEIVLLDKTGTLTHGGPAISKIETCEEVSESRILKFAASLDQFSLHIVAKTIVDAARSRGIQLLSATEVVEDHGHGIKGLVEGQVIEVGQIQEGRTARRGGKTYLAGNR